MAQLGAELPGTSESIDGNHAVRKAIDLRRSADAAARGPTVKLADLTDNRRDICPHNPAFARVCLAEAASLLPVLVHGRPTTVPARPEDRGNLRAAPEAADPAQTLEPGEVPEPPPETSLVGEHLRPFVPGQVVAGAAPLSDFIGIQFRNDLCFVTAMGDVCGVITRGDIQKAVVRMWLFRAS